MTKVIRCLLVALVMIASAGLVQTNGLQSALWCSIKFVMAAMSFLTEVKLPRRIALRVMAKKNTSTMLSQEHPVGVK